MGLPDSENVLTSVDATQTTSTAMAESPRSAVSLPDKQLVVIEPSKSWAALGLRSLWDYRELLYFLAWRDVKVRYKQTALGAAWAILQPVFMMLIFTLFFGRLAGVESQVGVPYPLFALAGLVPWTFFANAVNISGGSVVASANLITKVYFPRLLVPIASVAAAFVEFVMAFVVLVGMMLYYRLVLGYGIGPGASILALPLLVILTFLFALSVGMWFAALNVRYRDVRFVLPFLIQLWLFISSVIVPSSVLPEKWRWVVAINPMSGIIEGYRSALFGQPFDWTAIGIAAAATVALLIYSAYSFRRMEKNFADVI